MLNNNIHFEERTLSMNIWLYSIIVILIIILIIIKIILMRKSVNEITMSVDKILKSDTNNLITISSNDKDIQMLAARLNESLKNLRKQEIQYQNGNNELKQSITNISHDLRTPLTAIRGYIDLMNDDNTLDEKNKNYLKIIDTKTQDLVKLTEQLFDFSKGLDLYKEINKENVCLNEVLEETVACYYTLLKEKNIVPKINICDKKIIKKLDRAMLTRIFENIIFNAIKYSDSDLNITMEESGIILFSNKAENLDITTVERIFDRYYTVENAKKSIGVGLSIAKQLVELNGGCISAKYKDNILNIIIRF